MNKLPRIFRNFGITLVTSRTNNLKDLLGYSTLKIRLKKRGNRTFIKYNAKVGTNVIQAKQKGTPGLGLKNILEP